MLELSLHTGTFGWHALLAPTFLPGLALQLPFSLLAWLAARLLLRAAERGRPRARRSRPRRARPLSPSSSPPPAAAALRARVPPRRAARRSRRRLPQAGRIRASDPTIRRRRQRHETSQSRSVRARRARGARVAAERVRARAREPARRAGEDRLQVFTLAVPTEKEGRDDDDDRADAAVRLRDRLVRPVARLEAHACSRPASGDAAVVQKVTWSGGAVPTGEDAAFSFLAQHRRRRGRYTFARAADVLRRLRRRLVRPGVVRHAGAGHRGASRRSAAAARRRSTIVALALGVLALVVAVVGSRRARRPAARMTAPAQAARRVAALAAGVAAVVVIVLLLHGTPGPAERSARRKAIACGAAGRTGRPRARSRRRRAGASARGSTVPAERRSRRHARAPRKQSSRCGRERAAPRRAKRSPSVAPPLEVDDAGRIGRPELARGSVRA